MQPVVYSDIPAIDAALLERAKGFAMADLHEGLGAVAGREGLMAPTMRPLFHGARLCGQAVTCYNYPGDNLMLHVAIKLAKPGQIVVATNGGSAQGALWGELVTVFARLKGIGGAVVDGAIRDTDPIRALAFPVFSTSISASHPEKRGPGSANVPVVVAGITVNPGDVIVGDNDGVLVIPPRYLEPAMNAAQARVDKEAGFREKLAAGKTMFDLLNLQPLLDAAGVVQKKGIWRDDHG
ncbi:MAG TPA: 4-carboxy-4-hydroxy-2-oxoadipate aldolase/oxaloacetate decarboxylase [Kiloniellales bacterium]|nr:4-carboxy-4-hydroxy-2-oxoadipate aldolase/oxaloacetate decarboxylase [Kiloniellales bacterium]